MSERPLQALDALLLCIRSERPRIAQMTDALVLAKSALLASRPICPHHDDLALHVQVIDEIDHTLRDPGYRTGEDFFATQRKGLQSALQLEYEADVEGEMAKGFDGWPGHPDMER